MPIIYIIMNQLIYQSSKCMNLDMYIIILKENISKYILMIIYWCDHISYHGYFEKFFFNLHKKQTSMQVYFSLIVLFQIGTDSIFFNTVYYMQVLIIVKLYFQGK